MGSLEEKLRSARGFIEAGLLIGAITFNPLQMYNADAQTKLVQQYKKVGTEQDKAGVVRKNAKSRGYLTVEELQTALLSIRSFDEGGSDVIRQNFLLYRFYADIIKNDWLPFKAMLYLSLEKENYDEAELIRRTWADYLNHWYAHIKFIASPTYPNWAYEAPEIAQKIKLQLEKLQIPGLTDPVLIKLRKDLMFSVQENKWDAARNIQETINGRIKELQPQAQQQMTDKRTLEDKTTVVIQQQSQPSEQYIKVEQIPRYGATDMARAINILDGKGGKLDPKAEGTLKLIDILFKR